MSKTILVTGAAGYIGSIATYILLDKGYHIIALDNLSTGHQGAIDFLSSKAKPDQFVFYNINTNDNLNQIFEQHQIDAVLHYAAALSVNESMENPQKYFSNNVGGTLNLLNTMLDHGVNKIVFSSTCATYGNSKYVPIDEKHPTNPTSPYGASKLMVEQILAWYSQLKSLRYVALRYFNVCGASDDGLIGDAKKPSVHLVQNAVRGALSIEEFQLTCATVNTPDQTPIRDYINVVDLDLAHLKALDYLLNGGQSEVINLGTGVGHSVLEIVNTVGDILDYKFEIKKGTPRQGESDKLIASIDKAKQILDWEPTHTLEDSVNTLVKWYKSHPNGW